MAWVRLKHNTTGEIRYAASTDGEDLAVWTAVPVVGDRCPEAFESVDDTGAIILDSAAQTVIVEEGQLNRLTRRQLFRLAVRRAKADLIDDLQAENIITANQANRLRNRLGVA